MRRCVEAARPDALVVVAAEHFANFFMNNMPAYCMGIADAYEGPIEDEAWLGIERRRVPGKAELSLRLVRSVMRDIDLAYAEEWKFDHDIMVPLHFLTPRFDLPVVPVNINCQGPPLTPLHRAHAFGRALRRACHAQPERLALIGTGGLSHWPCTPDSGTINEDRDRAFLDHFIHNRRASCWRIPTRRHCARPVRGDSRSARSSSSPAPAAQDRGSCCSTRRFPLSPSAARSPPCPCSPGAAQSTLLRIDRAVVSNTAAFSASVIGRSSIELTDRSIDPR